MDLLQKAQEKVRTLFDQTAKKKNDDDAFIVDGMGRHCPTSIIDEIDLARNELVNDLVNEALSLHERMVQFAEMTGLQTTEFIDMSAERYGAKIEIKKTGVSLPSYDGKRMVKVVKAPRFVVTEQVATAKAKVDEFIEKRGKDIDPIVKELAFDAFKPSASGQISISKLISLKNRKHNDPDWELITKALDDAIKEVERKTYLTFHQRESADKPWVQIPLALSKM